MSIDNLRVITGRRRSGKDYFLSKYAERGHRRFAAVQRISFSDELRLLAHQIFSWCPANPSDTEKDQVIDHPRNVLGLTPRDIWLALCGEGDRNLTGIDPVILLERFKERWMHRIENEPQILFVISDLRRPWEYAFVRSLGAHIIRVLDMRPEAVKTAFEDVVETFEVVGEVENYRDQASVERFFELMDSTL